MASGPFAAVHPGRYSLGGAVRSEWTKLRTVRSTPWTLLATVVLTPVVGVIVTATSAGQWSQTSLIPIRRASFDPTRLSLTGVLLGQLTIGVLGVLAMSAEYTTGTISATLSAIPKRAMVLVAKVMVFFTIALTIGEVASFGAFFIGQAVLTGQAPHASIGTSGTLRAVTGAGFYLAILGLLALGLGALLRHTAAALATFVAMLLITPLIVEALPASIGDAVGKYLPANIGADIMTVNPLFRSHFQTASALSPGVEFGLLCAYAAATLMAGAIVMVRRDA